MDDYVHILAYDVSDSTKWCRVESENNVTVEYYDFLEKLIARIRLKFININFQYLAWNTYVFEEKEFSKAHVGGGTDPTKLFKLIIEKYSNRPNYIHFITDGDINYFNYTVIDQFKETDKIDIYFIGGNYHNIEFYQKLKAKFGNRCNVYVNESTIEIFSANENGDFILTDDEQWEILNFDYTNPQHECAPFKKLISTIVTYVKDEKYMTGIRKVVGQLIQKSKGNLENVILKDDMTMFVIQKIIKEHMEAARNQKFNLVVQNLLKIVDNQRFTSGMLSGNFFLQSLNQDKELENQQANYSGYYVEIDDNDNDNYTSVISNDPSDSTCDLSEAFRCVVTLEDIKGPYILEASFDENKRFCYILNNHINKIRGFPWLLLNYLTRKTFCDTVDVITTPYQIESFFKLCESSQKMQNIYCSVYNFSKVSYVLFHKDTKLTPMNVKVLINLNYVWACNLFFNRDSNQPQISVGKKFEIVYIYLYFLKQLFESKQSSKVLIDDVKFTMHAIATAHKSLCKLPKFGIFYSVKLFKRMLSESKIFEKIESPITMMVIRNRLNVRSKFNSDSKILFVGCLQWLQSGQYPDVLEKHELLNEEVFDKTMGFTRPAERQDFTLILRILISPFFKNCWHKNNLILFNELEAEAKNYFNGIDGNFLKYLILSLNHADLPINGTDIEFAKRNIDMKLFSAYDSRPKYIVQFENLMYKKKISEESFSNIQICLNTLRPRVSFDNGKLWSDFCDNLNKELDHNDRLLNCDSQHTSHFRTCLKYIYSKRKLPDIDEFVSYLIQKYPFKLFETNLLSNLNDVIQSYEKVIKFCNNDFPTIKKNLKRSLKLENRIAMEHDCHVGECFHCQIKKVKIN